MEKEVIIISVTGVARDIHPLGSKPTDPKVIEKDPTLLKRWDDIDSTLKTYKIISMTKYYLTIEDENGNTSEVAKSQFIQDYKFNLHKYKL